MPKIHNHSEQFDGHLYPWCGRGTTAVLSDQFEATDPKLRCRVCDRDWFPFGQPDWHLAEAQRTHQPTAKEKQP